MKRFPNSAKKLGAGRGHGAWNRNKRQRRVRNDTPVGAEGCRL